MAQKSAVAARAPKKKASSWQKRDWVAAYIFIAPVTLASWYFTFGRFSEYLVQF